MRRRASGEVPSSIRLDHGDVLVMDGLAQSEYEHCTASGLQGPRVNLTYRWVTQHAASCPPTGVAGCVLPTCAQGLVEPSSRWLGEVENKWSSFLGTGLPFVNPGICPSVSTWIHIRRGHRHSFQRPTARRCTSLPEVVPVGSGDDVGDCHDAANLPRERLFISPLYLFG